MWFRAGCPNRTESRIPPLKLTLRVLRDGTVIDTLERRVNQFGGDQLIGKRYK